MSFMPKIKVPKQNADKDDKKSEDWEEAEIQFRDWLQAKKVPFMRISQLENSEYSDELRSNDTARPDFFILIKGIGAIAVDVKLRRTYTYSEEKKKHGKKKFYVNVHERDRLINFEDSFHMNTWCCFIEKDQDTSDEGAFYFCPIKAFSDETLERKQLLDGLEGILLEQEKMKLIPATPDGSLRDLLCD